MRNEEEQFSEDGECRRCVYWYEDVSWCRKRETDMPGWEGCEEYRPDPTYISEE